MHSLDFEEFLIAKGMNETVIDAVKTRIGSKSALGQSIRSVLDFPVDGLRDSKFRQTQVLSITLTFSHKRFSPEEAWSMLRSTPIEDCSNQCEILNRFGANITSIFDGNGKLTCKEEDSHGFPALHVIVILDHPVLVKMHIGEDALVCLNDRIAVPITGISSNRFYLST